MATTSIGQNDGTNDWAWDGTMKVVYINANFNISGLGRMVDTNGFFGRVNAGGSGGARAWKNGGVVLDTTTDGVALGNVGAGNSAQADASCSWHTSNGDVPTTSADNWLFGYNCSSGLYCPYTNGGNNTWDQTNGVNAFATAGHIHAYGDYFIVQHYVKIGGVMTKKFREVKVAGSMKIVKRYVKVAGTMKQVAQFNEAPFDPVHAQPVWHEDENGILIPGVVTWEGPLYLGPPGAREFHLHGQKILQPRPYELAIA